MPTAMRLLRGKSFLDDNAPDLAIIRNSRFQGPHGLGLRAADAPLERVQAVLQTVVHIVVVPAVWALIEDADSELALPLRTVFAEACQEIREIERRMDLVERELTALARQRPAVERLMQVPGIGLLTSTAMVGFVGELRRFRSGRHLASDLGLTPREYSSGLRQRLGRISKRGDAYLRVRLVHGARAVLSRARTAAKPDRLRVWAMELEKRTHHNTATVALANKIARIAWAVSVKDAEYRRAGTQPGRLTTTSL
jgi:transposase